MKVTTKLAAISAAALLAGAGVANAATYEVNMYGSSAQYNFWNAAAASYLGTIGCSNITTVTDHGGATYTNVTGTACTGVPSGSGSDTVIIRYASKASYAGFAAMNNCPDTTDVNPASSIFTNGLSPNMTGPNPSATLTQDCQASVNGGNPANFRWYLDETSATPYQAICLPVNVASSDVAVTDFIESTVNAYQNGPASTSNLTTRSIALNYGFGSASCIGVPPGASSSSPITIPFGIFVNNCVANNKCINDAAHVATNKIGQLCATDADCGNGTSGTTAGVCSWTSSNATATGAVSINTPNSSTANSPNTITNLSREQAACLFAGTCENWDDFGPYYADQAVVDCLRFAGSGTVASMDWEIIQPTAPGANALSLPTHQRLASGTCNKNYGTYPYAPYGTSNGLLSGTYATLASGNESSANLQNCGVIWFNDSSGNELSCIAGNSIAAASFLPSGLSTWTNLAANGNSCMGGIGIIDVDKIQTGSTNANVSTVLYDGKGVASGVNTGLTFNTTANPLPTIREQIKDGSYEYVADEVMYFVPTGSGVTNPYTTNNTSGAMLANILVNTAGGGTGSLDAFAANPSNINSTFLGVHANYYAARSELLFTKAGALSGNEPTLTTFPTVTNP